MSLTGLIAFDLFFGVVFFISVYAVYRHWRNNKENNKLF